MQPIQLNEQQIETILNDGTKLWFPVDLSTRPKHKEYQHFCSKCDCSRTHIHLGDGQYKCGYCRATFQGKWKMFELGDGEFEDLIYQVPSPIQPNQSYFVQEEFKDITPTYQETIDEFPRWVCGRKGPYVLYKSTYIFDDKHITWTPSDQMTEQQSRIKFKCISVEVTPNTETDTTGYLTSIERV